MTTTFDQEVRIASLLKQGSPVVDKLVEVDGLDMSRVVLDVVKGGVDDLDISSLIMDARIVDSMTAAPLFRLVVHDPDLRLINSESVWYKDKQGDRQIRPIDIEIEDGRWYRLVKIRFQTSGQGRGVDATLEFEHRVAAFMRAHNRPRKVSRARMTRAEFILMLIREIKAERIIFRCPQLHKKQPIAAANKEEQKKLAAREAETKQAADTRTKLGDLGDGAAGEPSSGITVKGKASTSRQRALLDQAVRIADDFGAPQRATEALLAAIITESAAQNLAGGDGTSSGPLQVTAKTAAVNGINPRNAKDVFKVFLIAGYTGQGGAIEVARKNPKMPTEMIAQTVQGSAFPDGSNYREWLGEAQAVLAAFQGTGAESAPVDTQAKYYYKQVAYTRGVNGKKENTYECGTRLASEVNWRFFIVGRKTVVFDSEVSLFKQRARMRITPDHPAVISGSGDADVNKDVKTFRVEARLQLWDAPAGSVVIVDGWGVQDGRYLVDEVDRSVYSPVATIMLKKPEKSKREPRPEMGTKTPKGDATGLGDLGTGAAGSGPAALLYREAVKISDAGLPYVYGGGHGPQLDRILTESTNTSERLSFGRVGLDCSSSVSLALFRAGLFGGSVAIVSGAFNRWGDPGEGKFFTVWYNGGHVWIQFKDLGQFWRFDTSAYGDGGSGPRVRKTSRPTAGFQARHWPGL